MRQLIRPQQVKACRHMVLRTGRAHAAKPSMQRLHHGCTICQSVAQVVLVLRVLRVVPVRLAVPSPVVGPLRGLGLLLLLCAVVTISRMTGHVASMHMWARPVPAGRGVGLRGPGRSWCSTTASSCYLLLPSRLLRICSWANRLQGSRQDLCLLCLCWNGWKWCWGREPGPSLSKGGWNPRRGPGGCRSASSHWRCQHCGWRC